MAFFDRLQSETAQARAHVTDAPDEAIREGRFDLIVNLVSYPGLPPCKTHRATDDGLRWPPA